MVRLISPEIIPQLTWLAAGYLSVLVSELELHCDAQEGDKQHCLNG